MYLRFLDGNVSIFLNNYDLFRVSADNYTGMAEYTFLASVCNQPSAVSDQLSA